MKMTTKMIMLQNIEKMVMEQQRVDENDSYIRQDNEDLKYLEERYDRSSRYFRSSLSCLM